MKRGIADIELLVAQGLRLEPVLEICRGTYQAERGDLESARRILSALLETTECRRNPLFLQAGLAALGHVLIGLGRPREARDIAARGVRIGENPETCVRTSYIINVSNLALAEALLGETDHGARRIDRALREIQDSPMGCGTLHEARTRVALLAGDPERVRHHLAETEYWYRITRNPALIARYEKLAAQVCQGRRGQT